MYSAILKHKFSQSSPTMSYKTSTPVSEEEKLKLPGTITNNWIASLLTDLSVPLSSSPNKVTIVGAGSVGTAVALSILQRDVSNDLAICDLNENRAKGEVLDLLHGSIYLNNPKIQASNQYDISAGSSIIILCSGARQAILEKRVDLAQRNTDITKDVVTKAMKYNKNPILLCVANPLDLITYVAWKVSGLPKHRVIGVGTMLDTARFKYYLGEKLGVAPSAVDGYIIGGHGGASVPVWSQVNVAGVRLSEFNPNIGTKDDTENWNLEYKKVVDSAYHIFSLKGYTCWAIGLSASKIVQSILTNSGSIYPVSVCAKGFHGIEEDIFLSLPAVINREGVTVVVNQDLNEEEHAGLLEKAKFLLDVQNSVKL